VLFTQHQKDKRENMKKVLGLDIGSNSIGFSLLELEEKNGTTIFKDLASNSIIFSEPESAQKRREARSLRRRNERKSKRNKKARKIFQKYNLANKNFISQPTQALESLTLPHRDVYRLREEAVNGAFLSKDEFLFCAYSILTDRGYNNMFSISSEDGVINDAVSKNAKKYAQQGYKLPSMVLTQKRKELEDSYQNIAIRNKKDDYSNSLDRAMHIEEFSKLVSSQAHNTKLFASSQIAKDFLDDIVDEDEVNNPFFQRPLKSFENMVAYCAFYDKYNPKGSYKKVPLAHVKNIERTIRQAIDNYGVSDLKTGEVYTLTQEEKNKIVNFWLQTPSSNEITAKNILKSVGFKNLVLSIPEKSSQVVLDIKAHRKLLELLLKYNIDFFQSDSDFYSEILLILAYYKNGSSRVNELRKLFEKYSKSLEELVNELASLEHIDGFAAFSLKFTIEILELMEKESKTHHEALELLGYYSKYLKMPKYNYLPPLEPTKKDIEWLQKNIEYFQTSHLFYQPMVSPQVKRILGVLRKLINAIIKQYGEIDEIRIEGARELNSKSEQEKIDNNQKKDREINKVAEKILQANDIKISSKNRELVKLYREQKERCLYSGLPITLEELFDENEVEVEHFIPRSVIWINSYKNKILVKKKYNQNKGSQHPVHYLKSIGEWENFQGRVHESMLAKNKQEWLSNEELIDSIMAKEYWQESYLNDTRSAVRTIQKYLNHYLYPSKNKFAKGEKRSVYSVSARAINELKYMWGVHNIMPHDENGKKDRDTNYHHTLDAVSVALCSNSAINTLHNFFLKQETSYKNRVLKEKLHNGVPHSQDGQNLVAYLKKMVEDYENNVLYVCPYNKRKTNMKGFKDGNLKLYLAPNSKDSSQEMLCEMERVAVDSSLLEKIVNKKDKKFVKSRSDTEVLKAKESIQARLDVKKQRKIIDALDVYVDELLSLRQNIAHKDQEIKSLIATKTTKKDDLKNLKIDEDIQSIKREKSSLELKSKSLKCQYKVKNGKYQIVKSLKLFPIKESETKADAILFYTRKGKKIERLSVSKFKEALKAKEPFVIKANESTLDVKLFNTNKGQKVGLEYFSTIANSSIGVKVNSKYKELVVSAREVLTLYKNDIIKVNNTKTGIIEYFIFNGGGDISGSNNKLKIKNINKNSFIFKNRQGKEQVKKDSACTPNATTIISRVTIDFFGNIVEV
jgi:CRISPR-associated endonuclease Csn1